MGPLGSGSGRNCADADWVTDRRDRPNAAQDRERARESGPSDALEDALEELQREIARTARKPAEAGRPSPDPSVDGSSAPGAPRASQSTVQTSRIGRLRDAFRAHRIRALLVGGALVVIVIIGVASYLASRKGSTPDVVTQGCVVHDSGAQATVVVTNRGHGIASYTFDVVFSQNQSEIVGVPAHVNALPAGKSETFVADSGSLDTSRAFTCTLANVHRLAG